MTRSRKDDEQGYVLVLVAMASLVIVLAAGFAVDLGSWYLSASRLQRSADAAALAGAIGLPNTGVAQADIRTAYSRNGFDHGVDDIEIANVVTSDRVKTTVTANRVPTYFTSVVFDSIRISRSSTAARGTESPSLGSPYNVLGTGDLSIPGIPKQNFWLAVNAFCSAKEDGDFFNARWDGNKGPMTAAVDANGNFVPDPTAKHSCPGPEVNADYNPGGYSYFVDIPPSPSGSVTIRVYDGSFQPARPDQKIDLPNEFYGGFNTYFHVWDTAGTPDNEADDTLLASKDIPINDARPGAVGAWLDLYTVPNSRVAAGSQYRVQVLVPDQTTDVWDYQHGINAFALGAFRSWAPGGCDTRTRADCPRMSGRNALSVFNSLAGAGGSMSYYFAEVGAGYIGQPFEVFLWDLGEGVEKVELLAPDGTPLKFAWDSVPAVVGSGATDVNFLDTSGTSPPRPNRSNSFKFNDRLVTLRVTLPLEYADYVANAGGDKWLRVRYTLNDSPNDRTTWGINMGDAVSRPPRLVRDGS